METMNNLQKTFVKALKHADKHAEARMKIWNEMKELKNGAGVRIHGLQKRQDLNGETAYVACDRTEKDGVVRWPIRLSRDSIVGSDKLYSLKEENLMVQCDPRNVQLQLADSINSCR